MPRIQRCKKHLALGFSIVALAACVETDPIVLEEPRIEVIDAIDPDVSVPTAPRDGYIVWLSTYSGTGRLWRGGDQLGDLQQVGGAEVVVSKVSPLDLDRGTNTIVIRFHPSSGGEVVGQAFLEMNARCTWDSHCEGGRCVDFDCIWD